MASAIATDSAQKVYEAIVDAIESYTTAIGNRMCEAWDIRDVTASGKGIKAESFIVSLRETPTKLLSDGARNDGSPGGLSVRWDVTITTCRYDTKRRTKRKSMAYEAQEWIRSAMFMEFRQN